MDLESLIKCPHCATRKTETMPTDACQIFYLCTGCGAKLRPKQGDCCVFCSFGSVPCPPIQAERSGRTGATFQHGGVNRREAKSVSVGEDNEVCR